MGIDSKIEKEIETLALDVAGTNLEPYLAQMRGRYAFILARLCSLTPPGGLVVEAGSSPGLLTELIRRTGHGVMGLDLSPEIPFTAASGLPAKNLFKDFSIPVKKTDITSEPFPLETACADAVMMNETIEHFTVPPLPCLKEIARILKPGGCLIMTTPNVASLSNRLKFLLGKNIYTDIELLHNVAQYKLHNREYTMSELEYLSRKAGLEIVERQFLNLGGAPLPPLKNALRKVYYASTTLFPSCRTNLYIVARKPA